MCLAKKDLQILSRLDKRMKTKKVGSSYLSICDIFLENINYHLVSFGVCFCALIDSILGRRSGLSPYFRNLSSLILIEDSSIYCIKLWHGSKLIIFDFHLIICFDKLYVILNPWSSTTRYFQIFLS